MSKLAQPITYTLLINEFIMRIRRFLCIGIALSVGLVNAQAGLATPLSGVEKSVLASVTIIRVPSQVANIQDAINQVPDGGIIEIANGTYNSPSGGWRMNDLQKGFTIRAAAAATVTLSGGGTRDILRFQNSDLSRGRPVTFQGLVFANGRSQTEGIAAGATLYKAQATFIDCVFRNNTSNVSTTVGGGIYVADSSEVFFYRTVWVDNISRVGGAGLGIRSDARVYVHESRFDHNITNPANHTPYSTGGGINIGNSLLRVTNTRFENNEAGAYGGALYAIGNWSNPVTTPRADIIVSNSTFINNKAKRDPSVNQSFPTEGGAINVEDQSKLRIYNSRFITNSANIGGGVNIFRAVVEIYRSTFLGNQANGSVFNSSFGGSISVNSADGVSDGTNNRPAGQLVVQDTFIQGRYGGVTTVAQTGGGIFAGGDGTRIDGDPGIPDRGTVQENRAIVVLRRVTVLDCDVAAVSPYSGVGGGLQFAIVDLTLEDSLIANSDALGDTASGGGIAIIYNSIANIQSSMIARNTSGRYGGGLFIQGSTVDVNNSNLIENEVTPGVSEPEHESYGAAVFATPDTGRNLAVGGNFSNNLFSKNVGMAIFDDDRTNGPINDVRYNGNQFYSTTFGANIYKNSITPSYSASGLNNLIVTRANGTTTDKSSINNSALGSAPVVGFVLATPDGSLSLNAAGDDLPPTESYVSYAWSGSSATLNSTSLNERAGAIPTTISGIYNLVVDGYLFNTSVAEFTEPAASFKYDSSTTTLQWALRGGNFLDIAIDQGVAIPPEANGAVYVPVAPSDGKTYYLFLVTEEGGLVIPADTAEKRVSVPAIFR